MAEPKSMIKSEITLAIIMPNGMRFKDDILNQICFANFKILQV